MNKISGSFNLGALKSVIREMKGKRGMVKCIVIPINENDLIITERGGVYFNWIAFEKKTKTDGKDTHVMKQSLPKEKYETLTDEQKQSYPIIGNLTLWAGRKEQQQSDEIPAEPEFEISEDDLPF
jgi:hypothetical protein